jgi:serine O-acetyltransferase
MALPSPRRAGHGGVHPGRPSGGISGPGSTTDLLFPHFAVGEAGSESLADDLDALGELLTCALVMPETEDRAQRRTGDSLGEHLLSRFGAIRAALLLDARAIHGGDPASESVDEVILAYPGFLAIAVYRIAHELYGHVSLFPRLLAEVAHRATGIDIHPGARCSIHASRCG